MRSFAAIFTTLSLPLCIFAAHHGNRGDRHLDLAVRGRGDVLQKRDFSGPFTLYDITTGVTACGGRYSSDAYVVALNGAQFGNGQQYCGASITITYNGITVSATIVDECPGCGGNGLDLTEGLFKKLAGGSTAAGVIQGSWSFGSGSAPKEEPTTTTTPKYTPPKTSSTPHYNSPSSTPYTTSSSSPSPSSSSTSSSTSTSTSAPTNSTNPTSTSSALPSASGFAQPVGTVDDGQTEALESVYQIIIGFGNIVQAAQT